MGFEGRGKGWMYAVCCMIRYGKANAGCYSCYIVLIHRTGHLMELSAGRERCGGMRILEISLCTLTVNPTPVY